VLIKEEEEEQVARFGAVPADRGLRSRGDSSRDN